jgi:hypothetical protein
VGALFAALAAAPPALAQTFNSGSTGADGAFSPTANTTLTLPPSGVFNFTTINIPSGVTVRFARNVTNTPVTVLASGNVTIAGTIDISGGPGGAASATNTTVGSNGGLGGPGGFDGGSGATGFISVTGGSGLGPGGGSGSSVVAGASAHAGGAGALTPGGNGTANAGTAGTGGPAYGTASLLPLVGGSGGGGGGGVVGRTGGGGGGGGGALVIASSGTITLASTGVILAQGGSGATFQGINAGNGSGGGGSGGAVRLVATSITGSGTINIGGGAGGAGGGAGSAGRLRVEAFSNTLSVNVGAQPAGAVTSGAPSSVTLANAPTLRIASVAGVAAPASPTGSFTVADVTLPPGTTNPVAINLEASNIPLGTPVTVSAKGQYGAASSVTSSALAGTASASTASASVTIPTNEPSVISASASFTLTAASGGGPVFVQGEEVDRVRVSATLNGPSQVVYVTRSGREIALGR